RKRERRDDREGRGLAQRAHRVALVLSCLIERRSEPGHAAQFFAQIRDVHHRARRAAAILCRTAASISSIEVRIVLELLFDLAIEDAATERRVPPISYRVDE